MTSDNATIFKRLEKENLVSKKVCFCVCEKSVECSEIEYVVTRSISDYCDISEVTMNILFLVFVLIMRQCFQKHIRKRKDVTLRCLQQHISQKYWSHNLRTILVLINSFFWCLYVGEVFIRWTYSERIALGSLVVLAPILSLISTLVSLALYELLEQLAAHQIYLICPTFLWGLQILNNGARFFHVVCVLCVDVKQVASSLYVITSSIALLLLIVDSITIAIWVSILFFLILLEYFGH